MKETLKKLTEYKPLDLPKIKALDLRRPYEKPKKEENKVRSATIVYQYKG